MNKLIVLILTVLTTQFSLGQELKPVTKKNFGFTEQYYVSSENKKQRHGEYKRLDKNGEILMKGEYEQDKRIGLWNFYSKGDILQEYNYLTKTFKYHKKDKRLVRVFIDNQEKDLELDSPPQYFGLTDELSINFNRVARYPEQAKKMGVEGKVLISAWVDTNDTLTEIKLVQGIMDACDKEVLQGLQKIENNWIAGRLNDIPIKSKVLIVFEFSLDNLTKINVTM